MLRRTRQTQTLPLPNEWPSGIGVKTESGHWYINGKFRHKMKGKRIVESWNLPLVVESTDQALTSYIKGKPLGFRDGSLIRDISDGKVYLIAGRMRRLIVEPEVFEGLGIKRSSAVWVSHDDVLLNSEGEPLKWQ